MALIRFFVTPKEFNTKILGSKIQYIYYISTSISIFVFEYRLLEKMKVTNIYKHWLLQNFSNLFTCFATNQIPQCCENGIAVKMGTTQFGSANCPKNECFACSRQQYLLGVHERCFLDGSLMKSMCAPGLSCMIYCSEACKSHNIVEEVIIVWQS